VVDDVKLLAGWRDGDEACGKALLQRHFTSLFRFFANKVTTQPEVDDLIQDTMLGVVQQRDHFRADATFKTYLFAIARNQLFTRYRAQLRDADKFDSAHTSVAALGTSPSLAAARRSRDQVLLAALRRLPVDMQIALELFYWEELAAPEIAGVLDVPEGTVRSRIRRGRDLLRVELQRFASKAPDRDFDTQLERWAREAGAAVAPR
jgi:RNA polymerase sigma-70 factor (ECF subfamily)